ncbi:MAG TPA: hypothetical protein VGL46_13805 [Pseudonocardiaceae bacterium]
MRSFTSTHPRPAADVLGGKGPYVLVLLFTSSRTASAWRRWWRRGSE